MEENRRTLTAIPMDMAFHVDGNTELCHATGDEVLIDGQWWNEYEDSTGGLRYGR